MPLTAVLLSFASALGIDAEQVRQAESIRNLHLSADRPVSVYAALPASAFEALQAAFGGALSLQVGLPNLPPLLNIDAGQLQAPLDESLRAISGLRGDLLLRLNLNVAKGPLLAHWGLNGGEMYLLPFLFMAAFERLLTAGLSDLDSILFAAPDRATLVVLSEASGCLEGPLLHIADPARAKQISSEQGGLDGRLQRRLARYRESARLSLNWSGFVLQNITPAHLLVEEREEPYAARGAAAGQAPAGTSLAAIHRRLQNHAYSAAVLYTANRSAALEDGFQSTYAGADNTAELALSPAARPIPAAGALARFALWPYSGAGDDRLPILQNVFARALSSDDPAANTAGLAANLGHLLNEARWHHRVFLDREIDGHFKELEGLAETVSAATTTVATSIDGLTKGLVEALLGGVGVVVLTMLAALVQGQQPELIVRAGLIAYAIYLLLFPGLYRMGSLWHSFQLLETETESRLALYDARLGAARLAPAREALAARKQQFRTWFVITAALYLLVSILLIYLAYRPPAWLF